MIPNVSLRIFFRQLFKVSYVCTFILFMFTLSFAAGISTDGTLGPATTLTPGGYTGKSYTIPASLGQQKGANLFHSFREFNVDTSYNAMFTGPAGTSNVISRVTGGNATWIDGKLGCDIAGANLWLLNPYGLLFGPNASLDVKGSFHASTADSFQFSDGGVFYTDPSKNSVLSVAAPSAFGFLSGKPASIDVGKCKLAVNEGQNVSLVGGDICIENGHINAPGGQVSLASLGSPGTVKILPEGLKVTDSNELGNISISNSQEASNTNNIDVSGYSDGGLSGSIDIHCKTFSMEDSEIRSTNYSETCKGGKLSLAAEESASFQYGGFYTESKGEGDGGDI
jgi:filamentous hemagglutinin family protein